MGKKIQKCSKSCKKRINFKPNCLSYQTIKFLIAAQSAINRFTGHEHFRRKWDKLKTSRKLQMNLRTIIHEAEVLSQL